MSGFFCLSENYLKALSLRIVMARFSRAIHVFAFEVWIAGSSPAMTRGCTGFPDSPSLARKKPLYGKGQREKFFFSHGCCLKHEADRDAIVIAPTGKR